MRGIVFASRRSTRTGIVLYKYVLIPRMLADTLRKPPMRFMYDSSWFKEAELDSLLCLNEAKTYGKSLNEARKLRDTLVSVGSFARSGKQGRQVVVRSVMTLLLASVLGLIPEDAFVQYGRVADLLGKILTDADAKADDKVMMILDRLAASMI